MLKINKTHLIIISAALTVISLALYLWLQYHIVTIICLLITTAVAGFTVFKKAIGALRYFIISIELLVTISAAGAIIIGEYWEAAALTFLFAFGEYLESKTVEKTRSSIRSLISLAPVQATVRKEGAEVVLAADQVQKGDIVIVKPGEKIAVDGIVLEGSAYVNQAAITGESIPVNKQKGDHVFSGTIAESGYLVIEAERVGEDTTFGQIINMVEEAQDKKARTQKFLEKFAKWYTPGIIIMAAVVGGVTLDAKLALTLLTISCPGALVLSAPVAVVAGIGNGAKNGVLIKGGEILERMSATKAIAFDKTGTLTQGKPRVTAVKAYDMDENQLLKIAAIGESYSEHPLGRAIIAEAQKRLGVALPAPKSARIITGQGLVFEHEGEEYIAGNLKLFESEGADNVTGEQAQYISEQQSAGNTVIVVGTKQRICGIISIADTLRQNAKQTISDLKALGVKQVVMLTGDNARAAKAVAESAGLDDYYSGLLPGQKVEVVADLSKKYGTVAMVGDGVNDAPALAAANLGIAVGGAASDVAMETADVVLTGEDISKLKHAFGLSRATINNIRQNIAFGLAVVLLLLAGVFFNLINMASGMLFHVGSEVLVVLNATRLLRYGKNKNKKLKGNINAM